jgi:hypothetical protein
VTLIERSVADGERKFALRALRRTSSLRRRVNADVFAKLLPVYYPKSMVIVKSFFIILLLLLFTFLFYLLLLF